MECYGATRAIRFPSRQTLQTSAPANSAVSQNSGSHATPHQYSGRRRRSISGYEVFGVDRFSEQSILPAGF